MGFDSLIDLGRRRAGEQGDANIFTFLRDNGAEGGHLTFGELDLRARAIAAALQDRDVSGEPVPILLPPGRQYICSVLGCLYAGAIAVPCYAPRPNQSMDRVRAIAADSGARMALCSEATASPYLGHVERLAEESVPANAADAWRHPEPKPQSIAVLQYSSGSTGSPKGIMLSHENLMHNLSWIARRFHSGPATLLVSWLPYYHDMGLIGSVLQPLYGGFRSVHLSPAAFIRRPASWLEAIAKYRASVSGGPNFAYDLCVESTSEEQRLDLDLSAWETAYCGAEPIRPRTLSAFTQAFARCGFRWSSWYPCYGLAEATVMAAGAKTAAEPAMKRFDRTALDRDRAVETCSADLEAARELVGCGESLADQKLTVVDPDTLEEKGTNAIGEIWLSGPSIARGYWKRERETAAVFRARTASGRGPFLRTGDLGFIHEGQLYITGRIKDILIVDGVNHSLCDIENTSAESHPSVRRFASVAFEEGEDNSALVVLQEASRGLPAALQDEIRSAIRRAAAEVHGIQVRTVRLLAAGGLPRTSSGKIVRAEARRRFLAGGLRYLDGETRRVTSEAGPEAKEVAVCGG